MAIWEDQDAIKSFIRSAYMEAFSRHQQDWDKLIARVEQCERETKVATHSLELLRLSLEALAGIRRAEPPQPMLPGIIDRE